MLFIDRLNRSYLVMVSIGLDAIFISSSYNAIKSYKNQLTEQIHSLEKDFGKTASTIKEMENTIVSFLF